MYHPLAKVTAYCVGSILSSQPGLRRQRRRVGDTQPHLALCVRRRPRFVPAKTTEPANIIGPQVPKFLVTFDLRLVSVTKGKTT